MMTGAEPGKRAVLLLDPRLPPGRGDVPAEGEPVREPLALRRGHVPRGQDPLDGPVHGDLVHVHRWVAAAGGVVGQALGVPLQEHLIAGGTQSPRLDRALPFALGADDEPSHGPPPAGRGWW